MKFRDIVFCFNMLYKDHRWIGDDIQWPYYEYVYFILSLKKYNVQLYAYVALSNFYFYTGKCMVIYTKGMWQTVESEQSYNSVDCPCIRS